MAALNLCVNKHMCMCYTCEPYYCKFISTNEKDFLEHIQSHISSQNDFMCFICHEKFESYDYLFNHIKETYTKTEIECVECGIYFKTLIEFKEHNCEKTFDINDMFMSNSEWREIQYVLDYNVEH